MDLKTLWQLNIGLGKLGQAKFTPNGEYIIFTSGSYDNPDNYSDHSIEPSLVNRKTGRVVKRYPELYSNIVRAMDISPDGTIIAAGGLSGDSIATVCVWDVQTAKLKKTLLSDDDILRKKFGQIKHIAFSKDGSRLFITIDSLGVRYVKTPDNFVYYFTPCLIVVIDTKTWQTERYVFKMDNPDIVPSPDNRFYALMEGSSAGLYDINNDTLVHEFQARRGLIHCLDLSPDSSLIALSEGYYIYIYSLKDMMLKDSIYLGTHEARPIQFFPNSRYLYYFVRGQNYNWTKIDDVYSKQTLIVDTTSGISYISPDSRYLVNLWSNRLQLDSIIYQGTRVEDTGCDNQGIITIYPNPSKGIINISINEDISGPLVLEIFDNNGLRAGPSAEVIINPEQYKDGVFQHDVRALVSGIYYLRLSGKNTSKTYKFVVKN